MTELRPALVMSALLAAAALVLTLDEFARPQPGHFSWPTGVELGAIVLLAMIAAIGWLVRDTPARSSARAWAKTALALDADLPEGLAERMNADVQQMQVAALLITISVLACLAMTARKTRQSAVEA